MRPTPAPHGWLFLFLPFALVLSLRSPAQAQTPSGERFMLMPYAWGQIKLQAPRGGFGFRAEGWLGGGHLGLWGDVFREHLGCDYAFPVYVNPNGMPGNFRSPCGTGRAWTFSGGVSYYPLRGQAAPYVGVGVGRRYYDEGTSRQTVPLAVVGVDLRNPSGRLHVRWEVELRARDDPALGFGVGFGL